MQFILQRVNNLRDLTTCLQLHNKIIYYAPCDIKFKHVFCESKICT